MKCNVGGIDKTLRLVAGIAVMAAGIYFENYWGAIGLVLAGTALINFCPMYPILGISTCKKDD